MEHTTADLKIVTTSAKINTASLDAQFTVSRSNDDTARMVRVIILLPIDVIVNKVDVIEKKTGFKGYASHNDVCSSEKCEVTWNSSIVISRIPGNKFDSYISIDLAYLNGNETALITLSTTKPPADFAKTFGAFVYGSLPDGKHNDNYIVATCV